MHKAVFTRRAVLGLGVGLSALVLTHAGPAMARPVNMTNAGVAIDGHDPVAYFTMGKAVRGDKAITANYGGATYQFISQDHKALFEADPARYAPQYGGYCAYGASQGYNAPVEADKFTVLDGKLYLNYNARVQSTWRKDTAGYITKADAYWATQ
jgi:YHS domain-containing protein